MLYFPVDARLVYQELLGVPYAASDTPIDR